MTDERRFSEEEVAAIFERATRVDEERTSLPGRDGGDAPRRAGLTLAEIRKIGTEVGISADAIEASARAVAHPSEPVEVNRRLLGMPVGVAGSAELPRRLTDDEFAQLVALLRDRFSAQGKVEDAGGLRSWRNGNLRFQLEPAGEGQRLRMQTYRQSAQQLISVGSALMATGVVLGGIGLWGGDFDAVAPFAFLTVMGGGTIAANLISLRGWAARRREQMREIAERAVEMASRTLPGTGRTGAIEAGEGDRTDARRDADD